MENASKALIMAGGILIGILIISLAVYLFTDFGRTAADINDRNASQQLVDFNSKFTKYESYKDNDGNWKTTVYDIVTLAGYAKENNEYYKESTEEQISVNIVNEDALKDIQSIANYKYVLIIQKEKNKENKYLYNDDGVSLRRYKCNSISYNTRGKVQSINFEKI